MAAPQASTSVDFEPLVRGIATLTSEVVKRIDAMREETTKGNGMSIVKMFELQISMTELENMSSASTNLVSAINTAVGSMTRNLKG
jgi:hypothetical protein